MIGLIVNLGLNVLGLWLATVLVPGFTIDSPTFLILAAVLLGIVNTVVRPIFLILTLPITLVTMGLFLLVLNAGMVALVAWVLPGFHVTGFIPVFFGWVIITIVNWIAAPFVR